MTAPVVTDPVDLHQSKIPPDDPRLRLGRERGRTLRAGPIVALVLGVLALVAVALVLAFQPARRAGESAPKSDSEASSGAPEPPAIPDAIRKAEPPPSDRLADTRGGRAAAAVARPALRSGPLRALRDEQTQKAEGAGILFETHAPESLPPGAAGPSLPAPQAMQRAAPGAAGAAPGAGGASPAAGDADPNLQERKNSFVDSQGALKTTELLTAAIEHPKSPYELQAGSIIPAVLLTAISSDLPGPVLGQVRENVYDSVSGETLLIPEGARLVAAYDSRVAWGQERVLLCWNRLLFPNGDSINLQCMPAADLAGAAGLTDEVDEHWWRILKGAAVASLLAATAQGVAGNSNAQGYTPTVPQMWAQNSASSVSQVGQQLTRRDLDIQPTITVRPGWALNVVVTKDMVLAPYAALPASVASPPPAR